MRKNDYSLVTIFSIDIEGHDNGARNEKIQSLMNDKGVLFKEVRGRFEGRDEVSYIVSSVDFTAHLQETVFYEYDKNKVLMQNKDGDAFYKYDKKCPLTDSNVIQKVGKLSRVEPSVALNLHDSYTKVNDDYFVIL
jgi:hypothetical protein